ncbi:MAG: flagellar motor switch protein FliN [Chitinispirillia bacterium]|nr:flagellar motor switch protein FliN [Chitinispirillia bacterium]
MSDHLSQDEIDSLLGMMSGAGGGGGAAPAANGSGVDRCGVLTPVFQLFCDKAGDVVTSVVTKKVVFAPEPCIQSDMGAVWQRVTGGALSLKVSFSSGLNGDMFLIMNKKYAAVLSDLMMMGDGNAEYADDHRDAIGELLNNVVGAFKTAFGAEIGGQISAANVDVVDLDGPGAASHAFPSSALELGFAKLSVEGTGESDVALLFSEALANDIVKKKAPPPPASNGGGGFGISQDEMNALTGITTGDFSSGSGGMSAFGGSDFGTTDFGGGHGGGFSSPPAAGGYSGPKDNIELLLDVELEINIELGRSDLSIKKILELAPGSIVELDKMAGEPVDLLVNNKVVAKGEVVVIDENFGIRIVSLIPAEDRIKSLR